MDMTNMESMYFSIHELVLRRSPLKSLSCQNHGIAGIVDFSQHLSWN